MRCDAMRLTSAAGTGDRPGCSILGLPFCLYVRFLYLIGSLEIHEWMVSKTNVGCSRGSDVLFASQPSQVSL
jgi:hypothetical protein